ncbi:MAG: helix-turn-helix domain-containing protein [Saprospiraceae bacterium]|nr:helix-turn-helix domain-containing protein [Saprospiraceae bacterium]
MSENVKTRQQIADEYGIDRKTLYRWFQEKNISLRGKRLISVSEQELIYATFGEPKNRKSSTFR